jgi:ribosomal protein L29
MAVLTVKQIKEMKDDEKEKKLKELKIELIKSKVNQGQGSSKSKQIKKAIARILTIK